MADVLNFELVPFFAREADFLRISHLSASVQIQVLGCSGKFQGKRQYWDRHRTCTDTTDLEFIISAEWDPIFQKKKVDYQPRMG